MVSLGHSQSGIRSVWDTLSLGHDLSGIRSVWDAVRKLKIFEKLRQITDDRCGGSQSRVECSRQLRLKNAGGQLQTGKITGFWELHGKYEIIVNCSGIGARALTGDMNVYPVRGQIHKVHAPWLKHFVRVGDGTSYIYPGISSVTLGGTRQKDDWRMSVDPSDSEAIFKACCALEPSLQRARKLFEGVGLRPVRAVLRLEKEKLEGEGSHMYLVHNYGHGGTGVTFHWGTAKEAAQLVQECVTEIRCRPVRPKPKL
ncbi:D-aspartate oxidase-like [Chiloscyllium punctatum]|uniref:D-aspartate oxidase-like n=1 Tax=Chiloscyllium punctatum TaxID=137246 RepID=UPI003B6351FF